MNQIKVASQYFTFGLAAFAMVVASIVPAIASAAQVTERSISLSSTSVSASNVAYTANFKSVGAAGAAVIEFCNDSPLIGQTCTAPVGMNAASAAASGGFTVASATANKVVLTGTIAADTAITMPVTNVTNPSEDGTIYARIVTYDNGTNAGNYVSDDLGTGSEDQGSVALSITPTIGVSGVVMETLTFCVSGAAIVDNCVTTTDPVVELGEPSGSTIALVPEVVSEGSIFTQISTNASSGAVVRLKSNASQCGGLLRAGAVAGTCDIEPALNQGITADQNQSRFGVKTSDSSVLDVASISNGSLAPVTGSFYNNSTFAMNFIEGEVTGVTSTFGDPFLDTASAPANRKSMELTFAATVNNQTPAGSYSADLSLIAVGKF